MMYMPDCLRGTMMLLEAPNELLKQRTYNLAAISFTPEEIAAEIKRQLPTSSKFDVRSSPLVHLSFNASLNLVSLTPISYFARLSMSLISATTLRFRGRARSTRPMQRETGTGRTSTVSRR